MLLESWPVAERWRVVGVGGVHVKKWVDLDRGWSERFFSTRLHSDHVGPYSSRSAFILPSYAVGRRRDQAVF